MKASQFFISTLKEAPTDAEVASHRLMLRAGLIKKLGAGIYTYLPMGLRVIRKVERIVREEMDAAGARRETWSESGKSFWAAACSCAALGARGRSPPLRSWVAPQSRARAGL